jgi:hypothetical protein
VGLAREATTHAEAERADEELRVVKARATP